MSSRILAVALLSVGAVVPVQAQEWVGVYNPTQVLTLNLTISAQDWDTIRHDLTNEIEVPAQFWADGGPEPHVAFALAEDPYAGFTPASVAAHFDGLRDWVTDRIAIVLNQVSENVPAPRP